MSKKRLLKNSFNNSLSWVISSVIAFVATPYMVMKLGAEGYGIFALFTGIVGYYGLLDLGLGHGIIKYVAKYFASGENDKVNLSINSALWVQVFSGLIGSAILVVFADSILGILNVSEIFYEDAKIGLYVSAAGFFFTMISGTLRSTLMGIQRYDITSKITILSNFLMNATFIATLFLGYGLREVIFINSFYAILIFVVYLFPVIKLFPSLKLFVEFDSIQIKELFSFSGYMFISKLTSVFNNQVIRFLISMFAGPAAVTLYVVPMKIIGAVGGLLNNISTVLFPYASELESTSNMEKIKDIYYKSSRYLNTLSTPIYIFIALFSYEVLAVWMGKDFADQDFYIMSLLSIAYLISSFTMVPVNIVLGMGHARVIALFSIFVFILGTIVTIPLIYSFGVTGAAIGMFLIQLETPIFIIYATHKIIKQNTLNYLKFSFNYNFWGILIFILIAYFAKNVFKLHSNYFLLTIGIISILLFYLGSVITKWIALNDIMILFKKKVIA